MATASSSTRPNNLRRRAKVWLVLSAGLFVAWIGWLAYLAATAKQPVVLSRPQFLVSTLDVIADVRETDGKPDAQATVREVHWPAQGERKLVGKTISVKNLSECQGWKGPGPYILPLARDMAGDFEVAAIPPSPGFPPGGKEPKPRIYPLTPETEHQLHDIPKPETTPQLKD
ncbi:MAG TPA: hypothetical protein VG013_37970 [Gemmataceae bacterium]|nr:hypothetical protein [Gemmataceae bacterium]